MRAVLPVVLSLGGVGLLVGLLPFFTSGEGAPSESVSGTDEAHPLGAAIADFDPSQIFFVIGKDTIEAIDDPRLVPESGLRPDDLVIGIELKGEARAYPVRVLSAHEIVNDRIRGRPIAVTW